MDLEEALLLQRQSARIAELESWLNLFIVSYGTRNGDGFRFQMTAERAMHARAALYGPQPTLSISYDLPADMHVLDVL
jgi:hypothetical protein